MSDRPNEDLPERTFHVSKRHRPAEALPVVDNLSKEVAPPSCGGAAKTLLDLCRSFDRLLWQSLAEGNHKGEAK